MVIEIRLVHFNDVYHIPSVDRLLTFRHLIESFRTNSEQPSKTLTVFSGDAFSPSLEASVLRGEHMLPILNCLGIDVACLGNHDFDFGEERLLELTSKLNFPWILSNMFRTCDSDRQPQLLGSTKLYDIHVVDGIRIGLFGLAGTDWPSNCECLPPSHIENPAEAAQNIARFLRKDQGCDVIIAVTHMRLKEDLKVAHATATGDTKVDLLLGGHDHEVVRRFDADTEADSDVIQQGCKNADLVRDGEVRDVDVKQYTDVQLYQPACMTSDSAEVSQMLNSIHDRVGSLVQRPMLHTSVPLDGRNSPLQSQETNLGNMLADAARAFYDTDIAFFNSGSVRCDSILGSTVTSGAPILLRDIINICPFGNSLVVKKVSGKIILQALENSVSDSHTDGRFLQISGLRITVNWGRSEGNRILKASFIPRNGQPEDIKHDRLYITAIPSFIASGFDGYTFFPDQQTIIDGEAAVTDTALMLGIFNSEGVSGDENHNRHGMGIERARRCIIVGNSDLDGLPIVAPITDGRITFVG